jgi:hypothetical protein
MSLISNSLVYTTIRIISILFAVFEADKEPNMMTGVLDWINTNSNFPEAFTSSHLDNLSVTQSHLNVNGR